MNREIKFRAFDDGKMIYEHNIEHLTKEDNMILRLAKFWSNIRNDSIIMQYTGLNDKNGKEIYSDDLLINDKGIVFRIYSIIGGFVFKAPYWMNDLSDLNHYDTLITESLSDAQNISYITTLCAIYSNIHEYKQLKK